MTGLKYSPKDSLTFVCIQPPTPIRTAPCIYLRPGYFLSLGCRVYPRHSLQGEEMMPGPCLTTHASNDVTGKLPHPVPLPSTPSAIPSSLILLSGYMLPRSRRRTRRPPEKQSPAVPGKHHHRRACLLHEGLGLPHC